MSYVQNANNHDIIKLIDNYRQASLAINDITNYLVENATKPSKISYFGPTGKA